MENRKQLVKYRDKHGYIVSGLLIHTFESTTKQIVYCVDNFVNCVLAKNVISITNLKESWVK